MLPLVALFGFWGLCLRGAIPTVLGGVLLHRSRPVRIAPAWDFREFWRLLKFGFAMDVTAVLATACITATMTSIVAAKYGLAVLGLFTFAKVGESVVSQFSNSIAQVFVPRINQQMGITTTCGTACVTRSSRW